MLNSNNSVWSSSPPWSLVEPCPGCSLGWFSGRESGGGKAHLCFFLDTTALAPEFVHSYYLQRGKGKIHLVSGLLPGLQDREDFRSSCVTLSCTLISDTLASPSDPPKSHPHLQFSRSQSPLRLLNRVSKLLRKRKPALHKPAAISPSSSTAQFSTQGTGRTKFILIYGSTCTACSCNICHVWSSTTLPPSTGKISRERWLLSRSSSHLWTFWRAFQSTRETVASLGA